MLLFGILCKNGRSCKTEYLQVIEELHNVLMTFAEVTTVALVKYHHHFLVTHTLQPFVIVFTGDCHIQFLNRSNDNLAVAAQSLDKFLGVVRIVNSTWLESFILRLCLGVEVVAVNDKHHLVNTINLTH